MFLQALGRASGFLVVNKGSSRKFSETPRRNNVRLHPRTGPDMVQISQLMFDDLTDGRVMDES